MSRTLSQHATVASTAATRHQQPPTYFQTQSMKIDDDDDGAPEDDDAIRYQSSSASTNAMTATLRLIPLNNGECRTLLEKMGKPTTDDKNNSLLLACPVEECNRQRKPIQLKLCSITDDIVDVDDDIEPDIFNYASRYQDGRFAAVVSLGRNHYTGIQWCAVSRALCDVSLAMKDDTERNGPSSAIATLTMRKAPGTHAVYLDGDLVKTSLGCEIPLKHGSIISLFRRTGFPYQVHLFQNDKDTVSATALKKLESPKRLDSPKRQKLNPPIDTPIDGLVEEIQKSSRQSIRERAHKAMESEFTCAMCFDVIVKSTFAYPCSHAFCEECSLSVTNAAPVDRSTSKGLCPTCRGNVEGWMPARSYDAQIWSFALQGSFERNDAEYYLERREKAGEDAPTEEERGSILNSDEGHDNDSKPFDHQTPSQACQKATGKDVICINT